MASRSRDRWRASSSSITVAQLNPLDKTGVPTAALIARSRLEVYDDAPHGLVITHRERLSRDLLAFVRQSAATS